MNKYRYIGKGYTHIPADGGEGSIKVEENEIVESNLDERFLLNNEFVLVKSEIDLHRKDFVNLRTIIKNKEKRFKLEKENLLQKQKKELDAMQERYNKEINGQEEELKKVREKYVNILDNHIKGDDEALKAKAKKYLKEIDSDVSMKQVESDNQDQELKELRKKYKEIVGKDLSPRFMNDKEWIEEKIRENK